MSNSSDDSSLIVTVDDRKLKKAFARLIRRGRDTAPVMAEIANRLRNLADEAFDEERAYDGTPWARLDDATIRAKGSERILWDEGTLRDSLTAESTRTTATVGVGATSGEEEYEYGEAHQFGTRHLPARPFLPLDGEELPDDLLHELVEMVQEYFSLE